MSKVILLVCCLFFWHFGISQNAKNESGLWKGVYFPNATEPSQGILIYLQLEIENNGTVSGKVRNEIFDKNDFALKKIRGTKKNHIISVDEFVITKKDVPFGKSGWCRLQMELKYDTVSGYLKGNYSSNDCRGKLGQMIFYRSQDELLNEANESQSQHWFEVLISDLKNGLNAPEIRALERKNFVFEPIYFDFDKYDIKSEYYDFLDRLIHVMKGHSDLRVKVIGHTDSNGTHAYNDELSKNRAKAIIDYFVSKGIKAGKLEFIFKGERDPDYSNETSQGRQKNRRVDFQFI